MTSSADLTRPDFGSPLTDQDSWWSDVEDEVEGYDLIRDKARFSLVGVPFAISGLSFHPGMQQKNVAWRNAFIACELRVAPAVVLIRDWSLIVGRRSGHDEIPDPAVIPQPGTYLVYNAGTTGDYRQLMQYLIGKELIEIPEDLPTQGGKNECRYDLPPSEWISGAEKRYAPNGDEVYVADFKVSIKCPRGLRFSDYTNEYTGGETAYTWYIA